jgi:hypothetical protein
MPIAANLERRSTEIAMRLERDRRVQHVKLAKVARELAATFRAMQHHDMGERDRNEAYRRFVDLKAAAEALTGERFR